MGIKGRLNVGTLKMIDGFMDDYRNGLYVHEIAKKYGISEKTIYLHLDEIAKKAGTSRESLLVHPVSGRTLGVQTRKSVKPPLGQEKFHEHLECVLNGIRQMKCIVEGELQYQEDLQDQEMEER